MIKGVLKNQHIRTGWPTIAKKYTFKMPLSARNKKKEEDLERGGDTKVRSV